MLIEANAAPQKRLFISLLTRDISFNDAIMDLIDNSMNAILMPFATQLSTAEGFSALLAAPPENRRTIEIFVNDQRLIISDNAQGIDAATAQEQVFLFGKPENKNPTSDRLSVYGIGLKRAIFKIGERARVVSRHVNGGFELDWDVNVWSQEPGWTLQIQTREPEQDTGTRIELSSLTDGIKRRLADPKFLDGLRDQIARTYMYFLNTMVSIKLNGEEIEAFAQILDEAFGLERENMQFGSVSCFIAAGINKSSGDVYRQELSGWYVFCNGRAVLFADKTTASGWGSVLPFFQPKHRPFFGHVFFVSSEPDELPWTTTKAGLNPDNLYWQQVKPAMVRVARKVISFLDSRYSGTAEADDASKDIAKMSTTDGVSVLQIATIPAVKFAPPVMPKPDPRVSVQYTASQSEFEKVKRRLGKPRASNAEVGRMTFDYYLRNEVD